MSKVEMSQSEQEKLMAAFEFVRRTGAKTCGLRYSDDEPPVVWMAIATYSNEGLEVHEVDASLHPLRAMLRLCERLADGGRCTHCGRPSGLDPDSLDTLPLNELVCWYQYDPELKKFRRGCEGES